jgi:hypothetical protein
MPPQFLKTLSFRAKRGICFLEPRLDTLRRLYLVLYLNPVVLPITTPQTTSIPKLTTVNTPAATQLKSIRGTPAIDAK